MAFAYPVSGAPALAAPTVHGYGLSTTPAVLAGVPTPAYGYGQDFSGLVGAPATFAGAGYGAGFGAPIAGYGQEFALAGAQAPIIADGFGAAPLAYGADYAGMYSGYQGAGYPAGYDAGFGGFAPTAFGGYGGYNTMTGAVAAPVAPARKVWQNGLRRSLVTGHPTRF
jgi:hypothetical protein